MSKLELRELLQRALAANSNKPGPKNSNVPSPPAKPVVPAKPHRALRPRRRS